ncbi:MAG: spermidine synthase, partial [Verrucomicrobiota bacterium]
MRVAIVSVILFLSGTSALLFQTLWLRLSGLAFGNSVWSAALILSSFMAGLGLGSTIAASSSLGRLRPLRIYAGLEVIVAAFGCTLVFARAEARPRGKGAAHLRFQVSLKGPLPWKLLLVSAAAGAVLLGLEV